MKFTLALLLVCGLTTLRVHGGLARLEAPEDVVVGIYGDNGGPSIGDARGPGPSEDDIFYRKAESLVYPATLIYRSPGLPSKGRVKKNREFSLRVGGGPTNLGSISLFFFYF